MSDDAPRPCPNGTDGKMICPSCQGSPTRWIQPTTANGSAELWTCPYCIGSGRVQCTAGCDNGWFRT